MGQPETHWKAGAVQKVFMLPGVPPSPHTHTAAASLTISPGHLYLPITHPRGSLGLQLQVQLLEPRHLLQHKAQVFQVT